MVDYRIERILEKEEVAQLDNLLIPKLKNDYPNFETWLKKARKEILEGTRIAIGIWKEGLIATSIVKLTASGTAELKTFFVDDDFREQSYGDLLFAETEMQCRKAGVTKVSTETYVDKTSMVQFLVAKDFLFAGREDLYGNGRYSYLLSKSLTPQYSGDPYDWEELGEWFLRIRLSATNVKDHPIVSGRTFDRHMRLAVGNYSLEALVEIKDQKTDLDDVEILHKKCTESDYHIPIFVAREFTDRASDYARQHGVITFTSKDIAAILGREPLVFREGPIAGMIVSIRPRFLRILLKKETPVYYVKGGPTGKFLKKGHLLVFYTTAPQGNVTTLGKIQSVKLGTPIEIWESISERTIFNKEEFFGFASIKQRILAIKLDDIWQIAPIEGEELDKIIPEKARAGSYIDGRTREELLSRTPLRH